MKSQHRSWLGADRFLCQFQLVFTPRITISQNVAISKWRATDSSGWRTIASGASEAGMLAGR
jgi:hypothetical protein